MLNEMYEEIPLPKGQKFTITKRGKLPFTLHLVSRPKYFLTVEEAERFALKLKEQAERKDCKQRTAQNFQ